MIDANSDAPQETRRITVRPADKGDRDTIKDFLGAHGLPTKGLGIKKHAESFLIALDDRGTLVAVAGAALHKDGVLLKALVVHHRWRSINLARMLVDRIADVARTKSLSDLYVVTTTAPAYFAKLGFVAVVPSIVPDHVRSDKVFKSKHLDHAVVMHRTIEVVG